MSSLKFIWDRGTVIKGLVRYGDNKDYIPCDVMYTLDRNYQVISNYGIEIKGSSNDLYKALSLCALELHDGLEFHWRRGTVVKGKVILPEGYPYELPCTICCELIDRDDNTYVYKALVIMDDKDYISVGKSVEETLDNLVFSNSECIKY